MKIIKRDKLIQDFDLNKIKIAVEKAMAETDKGIDKKISIKIAKQIEAKAKQLFSEQNKIYSVEDIQDLVEIELMKERPETARRYILYREERNKERNKSWELEDLQHDIWAHKYEFEKEGFEAWLDRISGDNETIKRMIRGKDIIPAGRILAGKGLQKHGRKVTYSNCYVITPPEDNIESIFDAAKKLARTYSYGGGCGIDIGKLAPRGAEVNNAAKETSGAVSFGELYNLTTGLIGQNGRRGALMISIPSNHPDLLEFIKIKGKAGSMTKANISIRFEDKFLYAVRHGLEIELEFKRKETGQTITKTVNARKVFEQFVENNWDWGEPGALFWDEINRWNLMSEDDEFEYAGVNPCAEQTLPAGGSCLLTSINLSNFVINPFTDEAEFDYVRFEETVKQGVIYLNELLDEGLSLHPLDEQKQTVEDYRQIGLGVMGMADMFIKMGIRYGSKESIKVVSKLGPILINTSLKESAYLAKKDGAFPKYNESAVLASPFLKENATKETLELIKKYGLRNSQLTTIAPTGSISTMISVSGGIEPIFNISYTRRTESLHGTDTKYKVYTKVVKDLMEAKEITKEEDLPDYVITSGEVPYKERVEIQAEWQKYIDASISSTVNLAEDVTKEEVLDLYLYAWESKLKGITIFRDNCKRVGILTNNEEEEEECST